MPTSASTTWTVAGVQPAHRPDQAILKAIKLPASVTYSAGTILGELVGNNEVQTITIDATGGTFTTTFGGQTTSAVAYNARASALQTALEALSTIGSGNVSVTQPKRLFTLTASAGTDAGTFFLKVTYGGEEFTTASLAYNASASDIDTAIEALPHLPDSAVSVSGSGPWVLTFSDSLSGALKLEVVTDSTIDNPVWEGGIAITEGLHPYVVEFQNDLGYTNVAAMTTGAGSLTGGAGTATVATLTAGSAGTPGTFSEYSSTATNGAQSPKCVLQFAVATDASGGHVLGTGSTGQFSDTVVTVPAYFGGYFYFSDVPAMTTSILSAIGGTVVNGSVAGGGIFKF